MDKLGTLQGREFRFRPILYISCQCVEFQEVAIELVLKGYELLTARIHERGVDAIFKEIK